MRIPSLRVPARWLALGAAALLVACSATDHVQTVALPAPSSTPAVAIDDARLVGVLAGRQSDALALLGEEPWVALEPRQLRALGGAEPRDALRPYLVRIVRGFGGAPSLSGQLAGDQLMLLHVSYGRALQPPEKIPVIVLLERAPAAVRAGMLVIPH